jgi:hypothetical protein
MALFACFSRPPKADSKARQKRDSARFLSAESGDFQVGDAAEPVENGGLLENC